MRISDWSSDVCSSDLDPAEAKRELGLPLLGSIPKIDEAPKEILLDRKSDLVDAYLTVQTNLAFSTEHGVPRSFSVTSTRSEEHTSELQSLMRISYAVFCLKKKNNIQHEQQE